MTITNESIASKVEWDLNIALAAAVGISRSRAKVFSRYSITTDAINLIAEYEGRFYKIKTIDGAVFGDAYIQAICDVVREMLTSKA